MLAGHVLGFRREPELERRPADVCSAGQRIIPRLAARISSRSGTP